jgi:hypothetical protein
MDIKTGLATVGLLVVSSLPTFAELRNWLVPLPDTQLPAATSVLKFTDTSINYGSRARVRIFRPDGVYDIDNTGQAVPAPEAYGGSTGPTDRR